MHIGFLLVFTAYLSNAVISGKLPLYYSGCRSSNAVGVAKRPHSMACSARIAADTETDTHTKYRNPCCACVPRVKIARRIK
jgi:hypothetical protein